MLPSLAPAPPNVQLITVRSPPVLQIAPPPSPAGPVIRLFTNRQLEMVVVPPLPPVNSPAPPWKLVVSRPPVTFTPVRVNVKFSALNPLSVRTRSAPVFCWMVVLAGPPPWIVVPDALTFRSPLVGSKL